MYKGYHIIVFVTGTFCQWHKILLDICVTTVKQITCNYLWLRVTLVENG